MASAPIIKLRTHLAPHKYSIVNLSSICHQAELYAASYICHGLTNKLNFVDVDCWLLLNTPIQSSPYHFVLEELNEWICNFFHTVGCIFLFCCFRFITNGPRIPSWFGCLCFCRKLFNVFDVLWKLFDCYANVVLQMILPATIMTKNLRLMIG